MNYMIITNCPESYNEFLDCYFFNLQKWFLEFCQTVTSETILKEKLPSSFRKNEPSIFFCLLALISLVDIFPCKYMLCLWSLIWSNREWGSRYLIIWLEITTEFHKGLLDIYFFKLALGGDCLELCFWTVRAYFRIQGKCQTCSKRAFYPSDRFKQFIQLHTPVMVYTALFILLFWW